MAFSWHDPDNITPTRLATSAETSDFVKPSGGVSGIDLGYYYDDRTGSGTGRLVYGDTRHGFLFGPTGTGKTSAWLMRNLLGETLNDASLVITDPKAELAAVCALARKKHFHHQVKIIDPFHKLREICQADRVTYRELIENGLVESHGYNPMAFLDPNSDTFFDDATAISEALIQIEHMDSHWSQSAQGLMTGLIMYEKAVHGDQASLLNVRLMLTEKEVIGDIPNPDKNADEANKAIKNMPIAGLRRYINNALALEISRSAQAKATAEKAGRVWDGRTPQSFDIIASLLARFAQTSREIDSIKSVADTQTRWLLSRVMQEDMSKKNSVDFAQLKKTKTSVFIILPTERMRTYMGWMRMLIVSALRSLYTSNGNRTVFLLDEMPQLGRLDPLTDAFAIVRGYKIQIVGIAQDMVQLKDLYKERYESFLANAGFIQFFTPNDITTAKWISERSGMKAIIVKSVTEGTKPVLYDPDNPGKPGTVSYSQQAVPMYRPENLMGTPQGTGLLFIAGLAEPVPFLAPFYKHVTKAKERALPNPYDQSP